jgi:hypothetical protein
MQVNSVSDTNDELLEIIRKYEEADAFTAVDIESDGGSMNINNTEDVEKSEANPEVPLLGAATAQFAYSKDISVFKKSIFK